MADRQQVSPGAGFIALILFVALGGCTAFVFHSSSEPDTSQQDGAFLADLDARGVPTGIFDDGADAQLGHAVCSDISKGTAADSIVFQLANMEKSGHVDRFTVMQAEEVVYWAVKELCPKYSPQLQEHWRDGE